MLTKVTVETLEEGGYRIALVEHEPPRRVDFPSRREAIAYLTGLDTGITIARRMLSQFAKGSEEAPARLPS